MIGIIDTETGNINSVFNILKRTKIKSIITKKMDELLECDKIILPGVGRFDACMRNLQKYELDKIIKHLIIEKEKKILCICVGMQLLLNYSEEGDCEGLKIIDGHCTKFLISQVNNIPHIGWSPIKSKNRFLNYDGHEKSRFYFCHSYYPVIKEKNIDLINTNFNIEFCAGFIKKNIVGVQFHPEKSLQNGADFLKNFVEKF